MASPQDDSQPKNEVEAMLMGILPPPPPPPPSHHSPELGLHPGHESSNPSSYLSAYPQVGEPPPPSPAAPPGYPVSRHAPPSTTIPAAPRSGYVMSAPPTPAPPSYGPCAQNWGSQHSQHSHYPHPIPYTKPHGVPQSAPAPAVLEAPPASIWRAYARDLNGSRPRPNYNADYALTPCIPPTQRPSSSSPYPIVDDNESQTPQHTQQGGCRSRLWRRLRARVRRGAYADAPVDDDADGFLRGGPPRFPSAPCARAQKLSSDSFTAHCDLEVRAGGATYPAHRAVLALHSAFFRSYATPNNAHGIDGEGGFGVFAPSKAVLELSVARAPDPAVQAGWDVVYKYCYGHRVALDTAAALHATRVAREYRFDELAVVLDAYLRGGGVDPKRCTQVFAAAVGAARGGGAGVGNTTSRSHDADVVDVVRRAAWRVLKERFSQVQGWRNVPWAYMVRLVKLNDLVVQSEMQVWHAVEEWCADEDDGTAVAGLAKLVRFPTMTREELAEVERAPLLKRHPTVARYVRRGIVACENEAVGGARRTVPLLDSSPVYRRRRPDALTFTDHIPAWSTLAQPVHTSTRYFAGALWRIVVDPAPTAVGLYVAVLSEESQGDVDVAVDFSVFVVAPHENGRLVKKQANNVHFSRSGQRAGFACVLSRADLEEKDTQSSLVTNDTLYIGASIRIRGKHAPSNEPIAGFDATSDDTAELISF